MIADDAKRQFVCFAASTRRLSHTQILIKMAEVLPIDVLPTRKRVSQRTSI
jgi:hypothetical protein